MNTILSETGRVWYCNTKDGRVALTIFEGSLIVSTPEANYVLVNGRLVEMGLKEERTDVIDLDKFRYGGTD